MKFLFVILGLFSATVYAKTPDLNEKIAYTIYHTLEICKLGKCETSKIVGKNKTFTLWDYAHGRISFNFAHENYEIISDISAAKMFDTEKICANADGHYYQIDMAYRIEDLKNKNSIVDQGYTLVNSCDGKIPHIHYSPRGQLADGVSFSISVSMMNIYVLPKP